MRNLPILLQGKDFFASLTAKMDVRYESSNDTDDEMTMKEEEWEEAKDILFMLRIPLDVDSTEESKEKFAKTIMKRHRKRGRYGPLGAFPAN